MPVKMKYYAQELRCPDCHRKDKVEVKGDRANCLRCLYSWRVLHE